MALAWGAVRKPRFVPLGKHPLPLHRREGARCLPHIDREGPRCHVVESAAYCSACGASVAWEWNN